VNIGMGEGPPLKPLHSDAALSHAKLAVFEKLSSDKLKESLAPGNEHSLKTRPDGTMLDGHRGFMFSEYAVRTSTNSRAR